MQDAQQVVLADKPAIAEASLRLDPSVRDELLKQLSTLAAVYHKLPASFVKMRRAAVHRAEDLEELRAAREGAGGDGDGEATLAGTSGTAIDDDGPPSESTASGAVGAEASGVVGDLLGGLDAPVRSCVVCSIVCYGCVLWMCAVLCAVVVCCGCKSASCGTHSLMCAPDAPRDSSASPEYSRAYLRGCMSRKT